MGLRLVCDGCACDLNFPTDQATKHTVGRLSPCTFCADCLAAWREFEDDCTRKRTGLVQEYETWRARRVVALRGVIAKVPDE